MMLLTKELRAKLPPISRKDRKNANPFAVVKFFTPDANWTWYVAEFDGQDRFWGLVVGFEAEFGEFSLSELLKVRGCLGLPVERDLYFKPTRLKDLLDEHGST